MIPEKTIEVFREILRVIRWEFPGSHPVIGGGAIRDSILQRPIKDVDVFMRKQDHETLNSELTKYINSPPIMQLYGRADMHGAWDFRQAIGGFEVQLILCDFTDKFDLANTFDIGLSRATFDDEGIYTTPAFVEDAADQAFRVRRADNIHELERSLRRVTRLQEKYPEFTYQETEVARKAIYGGVACLT